MPQELRFSACDRKIGPYSCCSVVQGDCLELLKALPDGCVDAVITDPPYGIGKAEWDTRFPMEWFDGAARLTYLIAVMPGTWNLMKLPESHAGFSYKWTLSAHLTNGMTKGGFGWGNWIPCVVYQRHRLKPQPEYVQQWCKRFAEWCAYRSIGKRDIDRICGTSDMGGWYLGILPHRCQIPAPHQWDKIRLTLNTPAALTPVWIESDYEPAGDCRDFAVGGDEKPDHPCPKPLTVMEWIVKTLPGDLILDPFCGSGTTLVAAKKLGRHFLGFEISPEYCAIARDRLARIDAQPSLFQPKPEQLALGGGNE